MGRCSPLWAERYFAMDSKPLSTARVMAYTDGASSHNQNADQRRGGWGIVITLINEQGEQFDNVTLHKCSKNRREPFVILQNIGSRLSMLWQY